MENQNSTPPGKKSFFAFFRRKRRITVIAIGVLLLIGIFGCRSAGHARHFEGGAYKGAGNVAVAAKDFEALGIVQAEAAVFGRDGYAAIYNSLVKEAAGKGADAIINITISSTGILFNRTWSGSALAIKYLDSVKGESSAVLQAPARGFGRNRF